MNAKGLLLQCMVTAVMTFNAAAAQAHEQGAAFTMTNAADDNQIVVFSRANDGQLTKIDVVSTGGKGSAIHWTL